MTSQIQSIKALRTRSVSYRLEIACTVTLSIKAPLLLPFASTLTGAPFGYASRRYFATTSSSRLVQLQTAPRPVHVQGVQGDKGTSWNRSGTGDVDGCTICGNGRLKTFAQGPWCSLMHAQDRGAEQPPSSRK